MHERRVGVRSSSGRAAAHTASSSRSAALTASSGRAAALTASSGRAAALAASLAWGDPGVRVSYPSGVTRVELDGSWARSEYRVSRASSADGPAAVITALNTLCLGACFADDATAILGRTYWYRFELVLPDGSAARYGPFPVTISPALSSRMGASAFPNPARGSQSIELFVAGRAGDPAMPARAEVFDMAGRRVHVLLAGSIARGATRIAWDGSDDSGRRVPPGAYVVQFATPLGARAARLLRIE
jgi:flagellar hook capping protein FlgD